MRCANESALFQAGLDIDNLEVLYVIDRVGSEGEACAVGLLDFQEEVFVFFPQAFQIRWVQQDAEVDFLVMAITRTNVADHADETALHFDTHSASTLNRSTTLALRASREALDRAGVATGEVTHLVIVTCTGFEAPGIDIREVSSILRSSL